MPGFRRSVLRAFYQVMGLASHPYPYSGLFLASYSPSCPGHLGLVRSRPALRDLNAMLAPESFLLDATYALGATALRVQPFTGRVARVLCDVASPKSVAEAAAQGDAKGAEVDRVFMALLDTKDGRLEDALARLATEHPDRTSRTTRLVAASFCDLLGRVEECDQWLAGIPDDDASLPRPRDSILFQIGLVTAALGAAPGAVAGSQGRVASAALEIINRSATEGPMSTAQIIATAFLKLAAGRKDPTLINRDGYNILYRDARKGHDLFVLDASLALLSAVVLRAPLLCGERVRSAARVAERDLTRAVEEGDASTAASLRLLLAFLATRDGQFEHALERYAETARDDPSDPWPRYLAYVLCLFTGQPAEEVNKWEASYNRLDKGSTNDRVALFTLKDELVVALALGGSPVAFKQEFPGIACGIIRAAAKMVDAALVSALRGKEMSVRERLEVRAIRTFMHAWTWWKLKELKAKNCQLWQ